MSHKSQRQRPKSAIQHSGNTVSSRILNNVAVDNNATTQDQVRLARSSRRTCTSSTQPQTRPTSGHVRRLKGSFDTQECVQALFSRIGHSNSVAIQNMSQLTDNSHQRGAYSSVELSKEPLTSQSQAGTPKVSDIRKQLHPEYQGAFKSQSQVKPRLKVNRVSRKLAQPVYNSFEKTRTTKYKGIGPSVRSVSPYLESKVVEREENRKNKEKWVNSRDFQSYVKREPLTFQVAGFESRPPSNHTFRDINRQKWIAGPFKVAPY